MRCTVEVLLDPHGRAVGSGRLHLRSRRLGRDLRKQLVVIPRCPYIVVIARGELATPQRMLAFLESALLHTHTHTLLP